MPADANLCPVALSVGAGMTGLVLRFTSRVVLMIRVPLTGCVTGRGVSQVGYSLFYRLFHRLNLTSTDTI